MVQEQERMEAALREERLERERVAEEQFLKTVQEKESSLAQADEATTTLRKERDAVREAAEQLRQEKERLEAAVAEEQRRWRAAEEAAVDKEQELERQRKRCGELERERRRLEELLAQQQLTLVQPEVQKESQLGRWLVTVGMLALAGGAGYLLSRKK